MKHVLLAAAAILIPATGILAGDTPAPPGARVYFLIPQDGAVVDAPFKVAFGLSGMGVAPAGTGKEATGHHHLLIDRPPFGQGAQGEADAALPADDNHRHFGGGQTETLLDLAPGRHTLQLVLGDMHHVPHDPPVTSEVITITVQ